MTNNKYHKRNALVSHIDAIDQLSKINNVSKFNAFLNYLKSNYFVYSRAYKRRKIKKTPDYNRILEEKVFKLTEFNYFIKRDKKLNKLNELEALMNSDKRDFI